MKLKYLFQNMKRQFLILLLLISSFAFSQTIPSSNAAANCTSCAPTGWNIVTGTPDISSQTIAASTGGVSGGAGALWTNATNGGGTAVTLPAAPNGNIRWISLRDVGPANTQESISAPIGSLVIGREYEVVVYSLTATTNQAGTNNVAYAGSYIDFFTFQVGAGPLQTVSMLPSVTPVRTWGTRRLRFVASATSETIVLRPGTNSTGTGANGAADFLLFEAVNLVVTVNAVNAVPIAIADNTSTLQNIPITINVAANDTDPNGAVVVSTVDLDPATAGIQTTLTTAQGIWTVNNLGAVTFTPVSTFIGVATIPYTIQDNYTLDGNSVPATSLPVNISVTVLGNTTDTDGDGILDDLDLDDDNDGILDSVEGQCATTSVAATDGFDNPVVTTINGNNIQSSNPYNGWTADGLAANAFNIVRVNGAGYTEGPDNAQSGNQYVDINGNSATIYKQFTFATATVLSASAWFANRATANAGYVAYSTRIEILNTGSNTIVAQGNLLNFTKAQGDEGWFQSSVSNVVLPAGTYRIRMFVSDFGHVDTISYCFSTDTDADGIPNHLDPDSDGDGCADALEGSETVRYNQVYPLNFATTSLRGQIRVLANGVTTGTPSQVISTVAAANGVPLLVNNSVNNTGAVAGLADNTDGTVDVGQSVGTSQNSAARDAECDRCFRTATTTGTTLATNHGITALSRAGVSNGNWPMKITGAYTALDAKTKGLVINRLTTTQVNAITAPVVGMMVYDTTVNCLKIYDSTNAWRCFSTQTCDNFNQ
ncbi:Ig-like domain-containing protein [Chryseobacterium wangxinyae]|uniref:Ig-like domain-containing protein n=1 Tax=Chryseobacterium sp. CY353 TaxID=2997334 RepID=UPI00226ED121|nr:Ig-like domain-containing protein [Chryseobacterium sp. CY353]MCY0968872.1 Ig-like domain-containing protein [Chryseobacterium sp. CY353]